MMLDLLVALIQWFQRPRRPRCYEIPVRAGVSALRHLPR